LLEGREIERSQILKVFLHLGIDFNYVRVLTELKAVVILYCGEFLVRHFDEASCHEIDLAFLQDGVKFGCRLIEESGLYLGLSPVCQIYVKYVA